MLQNVADYETAEAFLRVVDRFQRRAAAQSNPTLTPSLTLTPILTVALTLPPVLTLALTLTPVLTLTRTFLPEPYTQARRGTRVLGGG